jgi:cobalt-zinc-cadmium efflux system membrane fusion protein
MKSVHRMMGTHCVRTWVSTLAVVMVLSGLSGMSLAGPGHDHGDEAPATTGGNGPRRLPDGSVFLPKPAQRQMGIRTLPVQAAELPKTLELAGKIVVDPNAAGKVQAVVAGRVTPGPRGLPLPGQAVKKGDVLAYVTPEVGRNNRSLAESRLQRLQDLADTVPRKAIEEAEAAVANEQLRAPVDGQIAATHVIAGQVVDARETLFEIVNPKHLLVEALAFDMAVVNDIGKSYLSVGQHSVTLKLLGAGRMLREQALPVMFRATGQELASLAVGQPVRVFVQSASKISGLAVPAAALVKNPANQTVLWVKTGAERFEPRVVSTQALDGVSVAVTAGLKPGDRVATQAATLINQIR